MSTVAELKDKIARHDWWYAMSDCHAVWKAGVKNWEDIVIMAEDLERIDIVEAAVKAFNNGDDVHTAIEEM